MSALRRSPRLAALLAAFAASGAAVALAVMGGSESVDSSSETRDMGGMSDDARFAALSAERSNRCDLRAGELRQMADEARLQGSCCFPMDRHRYAEQLRGLRHYRDIEQIPADPYDIPVALAKRLLAYREIALTERQGATYRRAVQKSDLGGPCCCRCWRWQAFRGQANYLITRRDFSASQVARVWDLEEGCGGEDDHAQ
jgi:hypothetical protein